MTTILALIILVMAGAHALLWFAWREQRDTITRLRAQSRMDRTKLQAAQRHNVRTMERASAGN